MLFSPLKTTGCKVGSSPQKLLMTLQTHIESTSTSERIKITSLAYNVKHSLWSLSTSVPNANTLEQHVQVVGGKGRGGQILCAPYSQICGIKPTITSEAASEKQMSCYPISSANAMPPELPVLSDFFYTLGNVSSLSTCSPMKLLGFSICELKVISISERTHF